MRRAYRKVLPALSQRFGIKGDDLVRMPPAEIEAYLDELFKR